MPIRNHQTKSSALPSARRPSRPAQLSTESGERGPAYGFRTTVEESSHISRSQTRDKSQCSFGSDCLVPSLSRPPPALNAAFASRMAFAWACAPRTGAPAAWCRECAKRPTVRMHRLKRSSSAAGSHARKSTHSKPPTTSPTVAVGAAVLALVCCSTATVPSLGLLLSCRWAVVRASTSESSASASARSLSPCSERSGPELTSSSHARPVWSTARSKP